MQTTNVSVSSRDGLLEEGLFSLAPGPFHHRFRSCWPRAAKELNALIAIRRLESDDHRARLASLSTKPMRWFSATPDDRHEQFQESAGKTLRGRECDWNDTSLVYFEREIRGG